MAKRRCGARRAGRYRLLAAVLFAAALAPPARAEDAAARAEPGALYAGGEAAWTLTIPGARAADVSLELTPSDAFPLVSLHKGEALVEGARAAVIRITFRALRAGRAAPPPAALTVRGGKGRAVFEPVTVREAPGSRRPALTLEFAEAESRAGEASLLTVRALNARSIASLSWRLREDSLLARLPGEEFRFSWIPLEAGGLELPAFTAEVVNEAGERETVTLSGVKRRVLAQEKQNPLQSGAGGSPGAAESFIENAFAP